MFLTEKQEKGITIAAMLFGTATVEGLVGHNIPWSAFLLAGIVTLTGTVIEGAAIRLQDESRKEKP